jgi:hypothetical protein
LRRPAAEDPAVTGVRALEMGVERVGVARRVATELLLLLLLLLLL